LIWGFCSRVKNDDKVAQKGVQLVRAKSWGFHGCAWLIWGFCSRVKMTSRLRKKGLARAKSWGLMAGVADLGVRLARALKRLTWLIWGYMGARALKKADEVRVRVRSQLTLKRNKSNVNKFFYYKVTNADGPMCK